jgi:hypothetical protein
VFPEALSLTKKDKRYKFSLDKTSIFGKVKNWLKPLVSKKKTTNSWLESRSLRADIHTNYYAYQDKIHPFMSYFH